MYCAVGSLHPGSLPSGGRRTLHCSTSTRSRRQPSPTPGPTTSRRSEESGGSGERDRDRDRDRHTVKHSHRCSFFVRARIRRFTQQDDCHGRCDHTQVMPQCRNESLSASTHNVSIHITHTTISYQTLHAHGTPSSELFSGVM